MSKKWREIRANVLNALKRTNLENPPSSTPSEKDTTPPLTTSSPPPSLEANTPEPIALNTGFATPVETRTAGPPKPGDEFLPPPAPLMGKTAPNGFPGTGAETVSKAERSLDKWLMRIAVGRSQSRRLVRKEIMQEMQAMYPQRFETESQALRFYRENFTLD